ncbi:MULTISPECIES: diguanylate cyclase [unclassified Roseovarius]|uniref:diguanylate cyclase n=1 Tax=unclassified Roseovarius TaxID=2614913 RepID=UPI00273CF771|nr:diguanylate cyclase [Roseovarius sp. MMSF_3350]
MSGTILIVDGLATNRIVLKVKLSAAYFSVDQASTAAEAVAAILRDRPQCVLISGDLPDRAAGDLIRDIHALPSCDRLPVLVLTATCTPLRRLDLLRAGAEDVMPRPFCDKTLLARLRSMSRHAPVEADLNLTTGTAEALGFAEAQAGFTSRGLIVALHSGTARDQALCRRLAQGTAHRFETVRAGHAEMLAGLRASPDVLLVFLPAGAGEPELVRLAELCGAPQTRRSRVLAVMDPADDGLAAKLLDLGVHDIAVQEADPHEITLRLDKLLRAKQADDTQKARLRTGLHAAVTDPLTGLYNRRYALSQMARMIETSRASGQPFALMVADLDHFKAVNDTYGHAAGDQVLTRIAHALRDALRSGDSLSRIGGEEFLVLMPQSGIADARAMAKHLCQTVRDTAIILPGVEAPVSLTVSIGATVANPALRGDTLDPEAMVAEADHALYAAKSGGRDMATISQPSAA